MLYKLRKVATSEKQEVFGLTVPEEVKIRFEGCKFKCEISGTAIVFYSGCPQTFERDELKKYNYEDCK